MTRLTTQNQGAGVLWVSDTHTGAQGRPTRAGRHTYVPIGARAVACGAGILWRGYVLVRKACCNTPMYTRAVAAALPYLLVAALSFAFTVAAFGLVVVLGLAIFTVGVITGLGPHGPRRIAAAETWTLTGLAIMIGPSIYMALAAVHA
jgi:uncharacterized protein (DUF983 family)